MATVRASAGRGAVGARICAPNACGRANGTAVALGRRAGLRRGADCRPARDGATPKRAGRSARRRRDGTGRGARRRGARHADLAAPRTRGGVARIRAGSVEYDGRCGCGWMGAPPADASSRRAPAIALSTKPFVERRCEPSRRDTRGLLSRSPRENAGERPNGPAMADAPFIYRFSKDLRLDDHAGLARGGGARRRAAAARDRSGHGERAANLAAKSGVLLLCRSRARRGAARARQPADRAPRAG